MKTMFRLAQKQTGQTSLIISMFLALIMGSIVLGLGTVTSAGSQQNVSSQESIQANYAAQSGINDAIQAIKAGAPIPLTSTQNCSTFINEIAQPQYGFNNILNNSPKVYYNCIYITATPANLQFNVNENQSTVVQINPSSKINDLTISWPAGSAGGNLSSCTQAASEFVPDEVWNCPFPVIRMDLYNPNASANNSSATALAENTDSFLLFPVDGGKGTQNVTFDQLINQPMVLPADCTGSTCTETLNFTSPFSNGYARLTSIYGEANNVTLSSSNPAATFTDSQIEIDSTGVDQDVIQRLQVRVPLTASVGTAPNDAVSGGANLCKYYYLFPDGQPSVGITPAYHTLPLCGRVLKPAIYLYPLRPELINVKLSYPTGFAQTIPTYNPINGWSVFAQPSGSLMNLADGKTYPYLYWEGNLDVLNFNMSQGFVVKGSDTAKFLSHELPIIGLNKTETAAFLQYWVPKIDNNKYDLIHFAGSEYTNMAPLDITPKPDSMLRVMMAVEPISQPVPVTPQTFTPFHRNGFTVVEWGGTVLTP
jgi:hypothetical protein